MEKLTFVVWVESPSKLPTYLLDSKMKKVITLLEELGFQKILLREIDEGHKDLRRE